ncbi:hypothetical protein CONCODRAFT_84614 [Conidiobolus coronatus NRRL 28638]|uniref:SPX domain-containing protein n=1 Tax=Conidiobolus coronatus (strain ATCC 28846 / CBS 209.66 / NRRL 28638) TaxID=796925 RepID=A0A137P9A0_CONC2|nr:hypothetical protein CONCODRAFT_84614 [Conidiobolus coronatus NRRL 28638]|eukprot:KXN71569.1 hypothetical protein CONCODRAFT_84614 [Conidiobolus coronatus NRRL 28638]
MKFGSTLKESLYSEWKYYYIDYDGLKNLIKGPSEEFTEKNEVNFVEFLEKELDKVASFQTIKLGEINRRIQHCQKNVESLAKDPTASGQQYYEVEQEINSVIPQSYELYWLH